LLAKSIRPILDRSNGISLRVPRIFDRLHFNFSYHVEHHIFLGPNSDYYPQVRALLAEHYSDRMDYILDGREAWRFLLATPRHYRDATTFTDARGQRTAACRLNAAMMPQAEEMTARP